MSQAIQSFTPLPPSYQGNFQQQVSAAVAPSSSSMGNGDVIVLGGVVATTLLLGVGGLVAVTQLGASSAKKSATSQVPQAIPPSLLPQVQSTLQATKKILPPQVTPPKLVKRPQMPQSHIKPRTVSNKKIRPSQPTPQYITLLGFIDPADGVYRELQDKREGLCGMHALNTILYYFFGEEKVITKEKFKEKVPGPGSSIKQLVDLANENGLDTREYYSEKVEKVGGAGIASIEAGIEDAEAFIISRTSAYGHHFVAMVRMTSGEGFYLSDSRNQDKRVIYLGTAAEALLDYQRKNNRTVHAVTTFHKSASAQGRRLDDPFTAAPIEGNGGHEMFR